MNTLQLNYAAAKAAHQTIAGSCVPEAQQKDYERHYWRTLDDLLSAEKALITWAQNILRTKSPAQYEQVKIAFEKPIYNNKLREQLIDLCFRLDAGGN